MRPRLTELAQMAGCAAKLGATDLSEIVSDLTATWSGLGRERPPGFVLGLEEADDAAVYQLNDDSAIVATIDFFAPIVDDPYAYGAIAAANALSDIYAMGADVLFALNILAVPPDLDPAVVREILRGGAEKVIEAGGLIVGGHSVIDAEPKYGLAAIGAVRPGGAKTKAHARVGDACFLTKPLGTGLICTAAKFDEASTQHLQATIKVMAQLNRYAAEVARDHARAMTDVTGFGLLGHADELANASGVGLRICASKVPLLPGAFDYAYRGVLTGGGQRNRLHLQQRVEQLPGVSEDLMHVLYDPQTSGGLLFSVPPGQVEATEDRFAAAELPLWRIGEVVDGEGVCVAP